MNQMQDGSIESKKKTIMAIDSNLKFKIVLIGDSNVGKSSIFLRFIDEIFEDNQPENKTVTMIDFRMKNQIIDDELAKLYIWDTAGQEKYRALVSTYFKDCHGVIGVFDLTDQKSFLSIEDYWINQVKEKSEQSIFFLVGNKCDLKKREITQNQIDHFCQQNKCEYIQISAKEGTNIEELFLKLSFLIRNKFFLNLAISSHNSISESFHQYQNNHVIEESQESYFQPSHISSNQQQASKLTVSNSKQSSKSKQKGCC